ncbi:MAG: hypothetical protein HY735_32050 [Verrucomicrobia bacterium]|nr:hypothetical protein [Verrucomicrobiota bacterium]
MLEHFDTVLSFSVVMLLLSLLVTTLVQMIVAVLGLRGSVLQWGLEKLLKQISPELKDHASAIAKAVLTHPMIQHVGHRKATSIRKEELIRLLDDLASSASSPLPAAAKTVLSQVLGVVRTTEFDAASKDLKAALAKTFSQNATQVEQAQQAVDAALADARKAVMDIALWFNAVMDRTTENFLLKTRWVTVGMAGVVAFYLHVDSLSIIRQLASQPELRAKLVQSAAATLQKAENNFALSAGQQAIASAAIADLKARFATNLDAQLIKDIPTNLVTREAGEAWINTKLSGSTNREPLLAAYSTAFDDRTKVWLGALRQSAADLNTSLRTSDLTIIPSPTPPWKDYREKPGHFLGTLMTAIFLSLGAPFWYNVLRQLANLRPAVAQKIEPKSLTGL